MDAQTLLTLMDQRVSTRAFTGDLITQEDLRLLVEAGRTAPTAMNRQQLTFTVVDSPNLVKDLAQALGQALGQDNYNLYDAKQVILISTPRSNAQGAVEVGLASQNIYLMATVLKVGIVWTNQAKDNCDHPQVREVLNTIGIDADDILYNVLVIGVPQELAQAKEKTEAIRFV